MQRLDDLQKAVKDAPVGELTTASFTRWFFDEPWKRMISPTSNTTVAKYIQSRRTFIEQRRQESETQRGYLPDTERHLPKTAR